MVNETHLTAQTNPPNKVCITHCLLCLKHVPSPHENGVGSKTRNIEKMFFVLLERYLIESSQKNSHLPASSSAQSVDNYIKDGFPICGDCFKIVESFCDLYHEVRKLELQLDWKIWKLKTIMVCAGRVPSRTTALQEYYKEKKEIANKICNYRKRVIRQCSNKLCKQLPRVALTKSGQESNNTSRAADAFNLILSSQDDALFTDTSLNTSRITETSEVYHQLKISNKGPNETSRDEQPDPARNIDGLSDDNMLCEVPGNNVSESEAQAQIAQVSRRDNSSRSDNEKQNDHTIDSISVLVEAPEAEATFTEPSISQEIYWEQSNTEISSLPETQDQRENQLLDARGNDTKRPKKTTAKPKRVRSSNLKHICVETETDIAAKEVHDEVAINNVEGTAEISEEFGIGTNGINVVATAATKIKDSPLSPSAGDEIIELHAPHTRQKEEANRNFSPVTPRILNGFQEGTAITESQSHIVNLEKEIECIDLVDEDMDMGPSAVWDAHFEDTEHTYTPETSAADNNVNILENASVRETTLVNEGNELRAPLNVNLSNEIPAIYRMQQLCSQIHTANYIPASIISSNPSSSLTETGVRHPYVGGQPIYQYSNQCPPQCTPETCPHRFQNSQQTFPLRIVPAPTTNPRMEPTWLLRPQHPQPSNPRSNNFTHNPVPPPLIRQPVNTLSCHCDMCIDQSIRKFSRQCIDAGPPMRFSSNFQLQNYEAEVRKMYFPNQNTQVTSSANPNNNSRTVLTRTADYYPATNNTSNNNCHQNNCCEPVQFVNPQTAPVVVPNSPYNSEPLGGYHPNNAATMTATAVQDNPTLQPNNNNNEIQPAFNTNTTEETSQNYSLRSLISCGKCNKTFTSASSHEAHQAWHNANELRSFVRSFNEVEPSFNDTIDDDDDDHDDEFNYNENEDLASSESSDDEKYATESKEFKLKPEAESSESNNINCGNSNDEHERRRTKSLEQLRQYYQSRRANHVSTLVAGSAPADREFKCPLCPASWLTLRQLISHVIGDHPEDPEQCRGLSIVRYKCGIATLETQVLFRKLANENKDIDIGEIVVERLREIYACKINDCRAVFLFPEELELHSKHHGEFKCNFCEVTESFAPGLTIHEWQKHSTRGRYSDYTRILSQIRKSLDPGKFPHLTEDPVSNEGIAANSTTNVGVEVEEAGLEDKVDNEKYRFHCPRCSFRSIAKSHLIEHHLSTHLSLKSYLKMCYICKQEFTAQTFEDSRSSVRDHIKLFHNLSGVVDSSVIKRCDQCSAFFVTWNQLSRHKLRLHDKDGRRCKDCGKNFPFRQALRIHRRNVHKVELNFKCLDEECKESFETEMDLHFHVTWTHKNKQLRVTCPQCKRTFLGQGRLNVHIKLHHQRVQKPKVPKPKKFVCEHCGKAFHMKETLERHYLSHSGPDTWEFMCSVCSKKCLTKQKLDEHMRIHTKEQPFVCQYCGAKYAHRHNLRIHVNSKHADVANDTPRPFDRTQLSSKKGRRLKPPQKDKCSSSHVTT